MKINLDKSKWQKVTLGDVATEYSKRINNPSKSKFNRFVGSSNIGQWDFRITNWETTESVTSAMKEFERNDYLLVRRSLYASDFRERAPRADFSGVCSGDILTIRENVDKIYDGFLITILNSSELWKFVVANASGSITRRIKWSDLKNYEFMLPPLSVQKEISELCWHLDCCIAKNNALLVNLEKVREVSREKLFTYGMAAIEDHSHHNLAKTKCGLVRNDFKIHNFFDLVEIASGQVDPKADEFSGLFQIGAERIEPNTGRITELKTAKELNITSGNYLFDKSDIIFSKIRPYFKKVANPGFKGLCSADIYPLRPKTNELNKEYLFHYLLTEKFTRRLLRFQNRTGMPKVNRDELGAMFIPLPTIEEQLQIVKVLSEIDSSYTAIKEKILSSFEFKKSLLLQVS